MKHIEPIEKELIGLRDEVSQMWKLVISQLEKAKVAFLENNSEVAREIISREKRVDAFELKIDSDSENYIALYNPVAVDLRLVLSLIKISNTLERIGDFAEGIGRYVLENESERFGADLLEELRMPQMFDTLILMLSESFAALESENTRISGKILGMDDEVDTIYHNAIDVLSKHLEGNTGQIRNGLKLMLVIRKLERIGDRCSNIVEEIVFYVDAKVLKHGE